jgi:hypothetical protein
MEVKKIFFAPSHLFDWTEELALHGVTVFPLPLLKLKNKNYFDENILRSHFVG